MAHARPRAEVRARKKFFRNRKVHEISYLLCILDFFISIELILVNGFEMCGFFKKNSIFYGKFSKIFEILKIFEKIEFSKKNFKLQIALKNSLFKLWTNKKTARRFCDKFYDSKKKLVRAHLRARRAANLILLWKLKNHGIFA